MLRAVATLLNVHISMLSIDTKANLPRDQSLTKCGADALTPLMLSIRGFRWYLYPFYIVLVYSVTSRLASP